MLDRIAHKILSSPPSPRGFFVRSVEADGTALSIVGEGMDFGLYFERKRGGVLTLALSEETALKIARALVWRYWVRASWCGLRPRLYRWAVRRSLRTGERGRAGR